MSENKKEQRITMLHGAGGAIMTDLIKNYIIKYFGNSKTEVSLEALDDAAVIDNIVLKSDSHAVKPIFYPGGDIGRLAVAGTVNDIAMLGATPAALACGFILEEGLPLKDFERILTSMKATCEEAGVHIITGDTKVIERGSLGGCVINVSGIGKRNSALEHNLNIVKRYRPDFRSRWILDSNLKPGDKIILSGTIAEHGLAILSAQEGLQFEGEILSDVKPLNTMVIKLLEIGGIVSMKDPTRGGIANALNEWKEKADVGILIYEENIPIKENVRVACEMLGLDPLEIGNEGKILIGVIPEKAEEVLMQLRELEDGKEAQIIGEATLNFREVAMQTVVGGKRIIATPVGDPIPRIC
jgi:hydrogenase expression/formation protein HypE